MINRLKHTIDIVAKENPGKSKFYILLHIVYSVLVHGITFAEYRKANFINLTKEQKKDVLCRREYVKVLKYLDNEKYNCIFVDKILFNKVFRKYIGRDFIDIRTSSLKEFTEFVKDKETFFVKRHDGCGGVGINRIVNKDIDYKELYNKLFETKQYLVEETIIQHPYLEKINSKAVNNIRIVTLVKDGKAHILAKVLRLSDGLEEVISCHDIMQSLDENGNGIGPAYDDEFVHFLKHPTSKFEFKTTKIPYMKEAIKLAKEAALEVPEVRYVGWDIAISEKGPIIIEGNFFPSTGLHQFYKLNKDFYLKRQLKEVLQDEYNNIK